MRRILATMLCTAACLIFCPARGAGAAMPCGAVPQPSAGLAVADAGACVTECDDLGLPAHEPVAVVRGCAVSSRAGVRRYASARFSSPALPDRHAEGMPRTSGADRCLMPFRSECYLHLLCLLRI